MSNTGSNKIEVMLTQSVKGLGNKDDIVSVAIPYAKNVLFAQGKAKLADKQAVDAMKQKKEKQVKHEQELAQEFVNIERWLAEGGSLKIQKKATPQGHLYEKVSAKDIQLALNSTAQIKADISRIILQNKIETIGETVVTVQYKTKKIKLPLTVL